MRRSIGETMISAAIKALPAPRRAEDGRALADLALEAVAGGAGVGREAIGIVKTGARARIGDRFPHLSAAPWRDATWATAVPLTTVIVLFLIVALPTVGKPTPGIHHLLIGYWWLATFIAALLALIAACGRLRVLLFGSGIALSALVGYDAYGPGGSMRSGASHGADMVMPPFTVAWYSPLLLVVLSFLWLLPVIALVRPPVRTRESGKLKGSSLGKMFAAGIAIFIVFERLSPAFGLVPDSPLGSLSTSASACTLLLLIAVIGFAVASYRRAESQETATLALAISILLATPVIAWLVMAFWLTIGATNSVTSLFVALAFSVGVPLSACVVLIRRTLVDDAGADNEPTQCA